MRKDIFLLTFAVSITLFFWYLTVNDMRMEMFKWSRSTYMSAYGCCIGMSKTFFLQPTFLVNNMASNMASRPGVSSSGQKSEPKLLETNSQEKPIEYSTIMSTEHTEDILKKNPQIC